MTQQIDARGLACPGPVIRTKETMEKSPGEEIVTLVDNEAARENVSRLAEKFGYQVSVEKEGSDFRLTMKKGEGSCTIDETASSSDTVLFVASDCLGEGSADLGRVLMKSFFYALTQTKPYPRTIIFVNGGVHLSTEGSEVLDHLHLLAEEGVEILSCGTCLDYYGLKDKLLAGSVSNMYTILEKLNEAGKVIRV